MSPWRANAAASPPGPTAGPDESEARERFDAATAAALVARPVVISRARGALRCAGLLVCGVLQDLCHLPLDSRRDTAAPRDALVVA